MRATVAAMRDGSGVVVELDTASARSGAQLAAGRAALTLLGRGQEVSLTLPRAELAALLRSFAHLLDGAT